MKASPRSPNRTLHRAGSNPRLLRGVGHLNGQRCSTNRKEARIDCDSRSLPACGRVVGRQVLTLCATRYFNQRSIDMEELGLRALHRRVAGPDVHRMRHVLTVLIEQPDGQAAAAGARVWWLSARLRGAGGVAG